MKLKPFIKHSAIQAWAALAFLASASASSVEVGDANPAGISYEFTVTIGGADTATFSSHVGAWSWEDNRLFMPGETPVGWTHTSNWVALTVTQLSVFTVKLERDATVPWPSAGDPNRMASVASMYPSFTIWKGWDNDGVPPKYLRIVDSQAPDEGHAYNNRGNVDWAEDIEYLDHYDNSTETTISRSYVLKPGKYTMVIGSNAPANDNDRQGYKATYTTSQTIPVVVNDDGYFTASAVKPLVVKAESGVLANDTNRNPVANTIEVTSQPRFGAVTLNQDGSFTYTPGQYFGIAGYDIFKYHVVGDVLPASPPTEGTVIISTFANMAGCYAGMIKNEDTEETAGIIKMDLTPKGTWTGSVVHLGKKYPLSGKLGLLGELLVKGHPKLTVQFFLEVHTDGDRHIHAHIQSGADFFEGEADRSPFSKAFPPPSLGSHKLSLSYASSTGGAPTKGGTGTVRVSATGAATVVGKLGDKTPFSAASALLENPEWTGLGPLLPVYAAAYKAPGNVSGELDFGPLAEDAATGDLTAIKPDQIKPAKAGYSITYDVSTISP
jgi:hypothetical protein